MVFTGLVGDIIFPFRYLSVNLLFEPFRVEDVARCQQEIHPVNVQIEYNRYLSLVH